MPPPAHIGRYHILGVLGQGSMGVVYRGRDEGLDRDVAVKVMKAETTGEARARFLREARAAAKLQHPHIVTVYELGEHGGAPFLAMELLEGEDLLRAMRAADLTDPRRCVPIMIQTLRGLGRAHAHEIVHRDVKPSNIFLAEGDHVKLLDFGVARLGEGLTLTGMVVGTPHYMSPEQVRADPVDGRSDLFSAALILYELLTGKKAYRADSVMGVLYQIANEDADLSLLPTASDWRPLRAVLERALARDRERRYPTARAMADSLAAALRSFPEPEALDVTQPMPLTELTLDDAPPFVRGAVVPVPIPQPATEPVRAAETVRTAVPPLLADTLPIRPAAAPAAPAAPRGPVPDLLPLPAVLQEPPRRPAVRPRPAEHPPAAFVRRRAPLVITGTLMVAIAAAAVAWWVIGRPPATTVVTTEPPPATILAPSSTVPATTLVAVPPASLPPAETPPPTATPPSTIAAAPPPPPPSTTAAAPRPSLRPSAPPRAEPVDVQARLDRANALYEAGRLNSALQEARAVLRAEPAHAEALALVADIQVDLAAETSLKKAREALARGDRAAALDAVREGLRAKENDSRLRALLRELSN